MFCMFDFEILIKLKELSSKNKILSQKTYAQLNHKHSHYNIQYSTSIYR